VNAKSFQIGDLLWKTIFNIGIEHQNSANGLRVGKVYIVVEIVPENSYFCTIFAVKIFPKAPNEKYLKSIIIACGCRLDDTMSDILFGISP
jgi:hypothetical protein